MAKKSRQRVSGGRGRAAGGRAGDLFTAAERKLLADTSAAALEKADRAAVLDSLKRVRDLRDKWRDLVGQQTRKGKRSPQVAAEANARSRDKAALLQDAVTRLERRMAALDAGARPVAGRAATKPSKSVKKSSRVAAHRATRAHVRAAMAEKTADLNRGGRPQRPTAEPAAVVAAQPAAVAVKTVKDAPAAGTRRQPRPPVAATVGGPPRAVRADRSQQRSARAGAKQARLAIKGVATRRGGHVLASGKRAQARRDKRSR